MAYSAACTGRKASKVRLKPFLETSYSFMPLVWGATLAFWLGPALQEGGHILPVSLLSCPGCPFITQLIQQTAAAACMVMPCSIE